MQNITFDKLRGTSVFAAAVRELDQKQVAERAMLIQQLEECFAIGSQARTEAEACFATERELNSEYEELLIKKAKLEQERYNAREKAMRLMNKTSIASNAIKERLRSSCDFRIDQFTVWADHADRLAKNATYPAAVGSRGDSPTVVDGELKRILVTVRQAVQEFRIACKAHIARAEEMKLEALTSDEIAKELDSMAAALWSAYSAIPYAANLPSKYTARLY